MSAIATKLTTLPREAQLRLALKLDAVVTGANGVAYLVLAGPLEDLLGVEASLLRPVGAFLIAFAAFVAYVATRPEVPRAGVTAVIEANVLWVIGSLAFVDRRRVLARDGRQRLDGDAGRRGGRLRGTSSTLEVTSEVWKTN